MRCNALCQNAHRWDHNVAPVGNCQGVAAVATFVFFSIAVITTDCNHHPPCVLAQGTVTIPTENLAPIAVASSLAMIGSMIVYAFAKVSGERNNE